MNKPEFLALFGITDVQELVGWTKRSATSTGAATAPLPPQVVEMHPYNGNDPTFTYPIAEVRDGDDMVIFSTDPFLGHLHVALSTVKAELGEGEYVPEGGVLLSCIPIPNAGRRFYLFTPPGV